MTDLILYDAVRASLLRGESPLTAPLRVVLVSESYAPSFSHSAWSEVQAHQIIGTGYQFGGKPLPPPVGVATYDRTAWLTVGGPLTWLGCSFDAKYAVFVRSAVPDILPSDPLLGYTDLQPEGGSLVLRAGILELTFPDDTVLTLR